MSDFAFDVSKWVLKAKANAELAYQNIGAAALERVKELTPVKTGYLRASWIVTTDPQALESANFSFSDVNIAQTIYIVNPVVYARRINYGFVGTDSLGRKYNQMGVHMVEQTMAEMPQIANKALEAINATKQ